MSNSGSEVNIRRLERSLRLLNVKEIDEDLIEYLKDICESTELKITSLNDNDEEARDEFYEVIETTLSELGLNDAENIVDRLIDIYRSLNDDDQDDNAEDDDYIGGKAGVDFYFIEDDGGMFKSTITYEPYFYLCCKVRSIFY